MDRIYVLPEIYQSIEFSEIDLFDTIEGEFILSLLIVPIHSSEYGEVSVAE